MKTEYYETDPVSFKALFMPLSKEDVDMAEKLTKTKDIIRRVQDSIAQANDPDVIRAKKEKAEHEAYLKVQEDAQKMAAELEKENAAKEAWKTSDTLYRSSCKALTPDGSMQSFEWAAISSFKYEGQAKYCFYYKGLSLFGKPSITYMIYTPEMYARLKAAVSLHDGNIFQASSGIFYTCDESKDLHDEIHNVLRGLVVSNGSGCLSVKSDKSNVQFFTPYGSSCNDKGDFAKNDLPNHYQCDVDAFAKLFSLP
jgi:hypothetical protein